MKLLYEERDFNLITSLKASLILFALILISCEPRLSTEELTQVIKQDLIEHLAKNSDIAIVELVDFSLVHKGGNEYKGVAEVIIENPVADLFNDTFENDYFELNKNIEYSYAVEVIYDGEMYTWEMLD